MNIENTRKLIDRRRAKIQELKSGLDAMEKQLKTGENEEIINIVRKEMSYDEFISSWKEFMAFRAETLGIDENNTERTENNEENEN